MHYVLQPDLVSDVPEVVISRAPWRHATMRSGCHAKPTACSQTLPIQDYIPQKQQQEPASAPSEAQQQSK